MLAVSYPKFAQNFAKPAGNPHGSAGLSGKPMSTLGFERQWNPQLSLDREQFSANVSDAPPAPAEMETILRVNRGLQECGP